VDESGFRAWLIERGVEKDAAEAIVDESAKIEKLYADQVRMGASLDHETWLDYLTRSSRGDANNQVLWVLSGMIGAFRAFQEIEDKDQ